MLCNDDDDDDDDDTIGFVTLHILSLLCACYVDTYEMRRTPSCLGEMKKRLPLSNHLHDKGNKGCINAGLITEFDKVYLFAFAFAFVLVFVTEGSNRFKALFCICVVCAIISLLFICCSFCVSESSVVNAIGSNGKPRSKNTD